jgi:hypothetical protein
MRSNQAEADLHAAADQYARVKDGSRTDMDEASATSALCTAALAWGARRRTRGRAPKVPNDACRTVRDRLREALGREPKVEEVAADLGVGYRAARAALEAIGWRYERKAPARVSGGPTDDEWLEAWRRVAAHIAPLVPPATLVVRDLGRGSDHQARRALRRLEAAGQLVRPAVSPVASADDFG